MSYETIIFKKTDGIGIITVNRPKTLNALNYQVLQELSDAILACNDDPKIRAVILTGAGQKAFISGGDIEAEEKMDALESYQWSLLGHSIVGQIEKSPKPFIAAINGYALGGGLEIALGCDLRIASGNAKFGAPEIKLGVICGWGGNVRLPRLVGKTKAMEMLMTGSMIDANEAYRIGLVNKVVLLEDLESTTIGFAREISQKSAIGISLVKQVVSCSSEADLNSAIRLEASSFGIVSGTYDKKEGMKAFLEKRKPVFKDQ